MWTLVRLRIERIARWIGDHRLRSREPKEGFMSLSRLLRAGILCAALLVAALALAPLADARPAAAASPAKKKCKKGKHLVKGKCKKKTVGVGETTTTSTIGGAPSVSGPGTLFDATGGIVVIGGLASTAAGTVSSIKYAPSRAGTIRFLLVDATAKVKYTTPDIATAAGGLATYPLPAPWRAVGGDRLAVWMGTPTAIGYTEIPRTALRPPPGALVGTSATPPAVGTVVSG